MRLKLPNHNVTLETTDGDMDALELLDIFGYDSDTEYNVLSE